MFLCAIYLVEAVVPFITLLLGVYYKILIGRFGLLDMLHKAYMGELFGVAFFKLFKERTQDLAEQRKWQRLIEVEERTAALLKGYLEPLGVWCPASDEAMASQGREQAAVWQDLDWLPLMEVLAPWIREYAEAYRRAADGATEHRAPWLMVAAHEEALLFFAEAERHGEGDTLGAVTDFLDRYDSPV